MPHEGVRIPYQEYIALGKETDNILCRPPNGMNLPFSYVGEHVTDGQAVSAILAILKSIEPALLYHRGSGLIEVWPDLDDDDADAVVAILLPKLWQRSGLDLFAFRAAVGAVLLPTCRACP
jgi:hypothetical protein